MVQLQVLVQAVQEGNQKFMGVLLLVACHVIQLAPYSVQEVRGYKSVSTSSSVGKSNTLLGETNKLYAQTLRFLKRGYSYLHASVLSFLNSQ